MYLLISVHVCTYMYLQVSLQKGYGVVLKDVAEDGLNRGYQQIYKGYVYVHCTVHVKKTCPNLREEYSSCSLYYNFTYRHCIRTPTRTHYPLIEWFVYSHLCTKNEEQPKLSSWCSNSRGMGLLKR